MQPYPKTAFENHFAFDHWPNEPRGMTPYEYALYKSQWESAEIFRKYLEISEPAMTTKIKMMKTKDQDDVKPENEVKNETKNGIKEEMKFLKGLDVIDQLDSPMYDCKTKLEIKKEPLDEIEGLEIMDKLDDPIKNEVEGDFDSKIETNREMKKKRKLETVEKLDARIKNEIKNFKTEVMELTEKLNVRIKNEIQNFKNEIEKGVEEEIVEEPGTSELKPKIELKPKVEFKRIKEEMEVQRGMEIIEKLEPPTKKPKLGHE